MVHPRNLKVFRISMIIGMLAGLLALALWALSLPTLKAPALPIGPDDLSGLALAALLIFGLSCWWVTRRVLKFR